MTLLTELGREEENNLIDTINRGTDKQNKKLLMNIHNEIKKRLDTTRGQDPPKIYTYT